MGRGVEGGGSSKGGDSPLDEPVCPSIAVRCSLSGRVCVCVMYALCMRYVCLCVCVMYVRSSY